MSKKVGSMFLVCMLFTILFLGSVNTITVHAAEKTAVISREELIMYPEMIKQLNLSDVSSKVKWTTSNEKIVSVLGTRGEKEQLAILKSGTKAGTCTITAEVGKERYKYKVTVKNDAKVSRAKLVKIQKNKRKIVLKVKFINRTNHELYFGNPYRVDKFVNGKWEKIAPGDDVSFNAEVYNIPAKSSVSKKYTIATGETVSDFTKGTYRLQVNANFGKKEYQYVYFKLE